MFSQRRITGLAAAGLAIVLLAGCASPDLSSSLTSSQGTPVSGGTLIYLEQGAPASLYATQSGAYTSGGINNNILDRLTWQDPKTLEITPWIASSWKVNNDATEYTFHLRDGVTFSNGTPLDAEAVKKDYDTYGLGNPDLKLPKSEVINNYDHAEVVDPLTITFFFKAPSPGFLQATSTINSGLVAPEVLDHNLDYFAVATNVIGSGPFTVASQVVGKEIDLVARKDYAWAPERAANQGRAYLDEVKYIVEPEDSVRIGSLLSGQADVIRTVQAYDEGQVTAAGYVLLAPQTKGVNDAVNFRPSNPLVSDVHVRQAIVKAIDLQEIHDTLFSDTYPIATSILSDLAAGYVDTSKYSKFDLAASKKLLDDAGWAPGADGIREKDGQKLVLKVYYQNPGGQPQTQQTLELIQQQLKAVGVGLDILSPASSDYATLLNDPLSTPLYIGDAGRADLDVIGTYFGFKNRNVLKNEDPELERLLAVANSQPDQDKRAKAVQDVQVYIAKQAYAIPILQEPQVFGAAPYVNGFTFESVGRPLFQGTWLAKH
ncbi:MAG: transporter substrate binding protein [Rhodoglobus sp.]|nr:transporter substrate binding protein [Rhodoglobus sp.]